MSTLGTEFDESLKLGHGDAVAAKAPARKFEASEQPDKTLWSPGIFAVLAMGLGAYLGRLRDIVNPAPNSVHPEDRPAAVLDEGLSPPVEEEPQGELDIAAFWQEIQRRYEEAVEQVQPPRRLYSSIRFNAQDFVMESGYADRPFQGVSVDVAANGFRFALPTVIKPKFHSPLAPMAEPIKSSGGAAGSGGRGSDDVSGDVAHGGGSQPPGGGPSGGGSQPINRAPVSRGPIYLGTGFVNLSMLLMWADFARAAVDPDGDKLSISSIQATSGQLRTYGSDAWIYVPERDKLGIVTLTFTISDGKAAIQGQAFLDLRQHPDTEIAGTGGDDMLIGTPGKDIIDAGGGDDIAYGREGEDLILGGAGDDLLVGGDGRDVIHGGAGKDRIFGGEGDDVLFGEAGDDMMFGENGRDSLLGGDGQDVLSGGDGSDRLFGENGDDVLSGDAGDDVLEGGAGHDTLAGGAGEDVVVGNEGNDVFVAGLMPVLEKRVFTSPGVSPASDPAASDGDDVVHGGEGSDTYDASFATTSVEIDLQAGSAEGTEIGNDQLTSMENAVGGCGDDVITASSAVNVLYGKGGEDTFVFASVASIANGGFGFDEIRDFDVGDKVDLSKLEGELGRLYFDDGDTSLALDGDEHKTLVKLYKKMIDDDDAGHQVLQLVTDIDGDEDYEIVIISAQDLDANDLILTTFHLPGPTDGLVA